MSQYLSFTLKHKTNKDVAVELGYYCTSMARQISQDIGHFQWTDEEKTIDDDYLRDAIDALDENLTLYHKQRLQNFVDKERYEMLLTKAENDSAFENLQVCIGECESSITACDMSIEEYADVRNRLAFIRDVLAENGEEYELVYRNC